LCDAVREIRGLFRPSALKFARQLGIWFHRTYGKQADFKPGPFIPPPEPIDATAPLREEIENLRKRVAESEDTATRARREAAEHARARETVEQSLAREIEERAIWEKLATESETKAAETESGIWFRDTRRSANHR
jgi:type I restriction enzyme R subunit